MKNFLPMDLQFFADETTETETTEPEENRAEETTAEEETAGNDQDLDSEKVVEKLQKRLASKTAAEKETKSQLDKALDRIAELENAGKKGIKELSDEEKSAKAQQEKDEEITKLKSQIKIAESTQQADEVLKDAGLVASKEVLSMIVSEDDQKTLQNVKALIQYTNDQRTAWEVSRNTGKTPKKTPGNAETNPFAAIENKYK